MCVRALRITVLESAGNFTRNQCHDLNAEKFQRVNILCSQGADFFACQQFSNAGAVGGVGKFQAMISCHGNLAEVAVDCARPGLPRSRHHSAGRYLRWVHKTGSRCLPLVPHLFLQGLIF